MKELSITDIIDKEFINIENYKFLKKISSDSNVNFNIRHFEKESKELYDLYSFRYEWSKNKSNNTVPEMEVILKYLEKRIFLVSLVTVEYYDQSFLIFIDKEKDLVLGILR